MMADPALIKTASLAILLEALGPVVAEAMKDLRFVLVADMKLDAAIVELNLMQPTLPRWQLVGGCRQLRFRETGKRCMTPIAAGFLRWSAIPHLRRYKRGLEPSPTGSIRGGTKATSKDWS
jgi:hypothetical protein